MVVGIKTEKQKRNEGRWQFENTEIKPENRSRGKRFAPLLSLVLACAWKNEEGIISRGCIELTPQNISMFLATVLWENPKSVAEREQEHEDEAPFVVLSLLQKFPILTSQKHLISRKK